LELFQIKESFTVRGSFRVLRNSSVESGVLTEVRTCSTSSSGCCVADFHGYMEQI
jgi:hypothetical protein